MADSSGDQQNEAARAPLELYYHPLSSYCQKVLIALYESGTPFTPHFIDLGNPDSRAELTAVWPIGKFPVLHDRARNETVPESTIIIEYLAQHYPGRAPLIPADPTLARQARLRDRFYDQYLSESVGKIVGDRLRPAGKNDSYGVEQARARLAGAIGMIDREMEAKTWAMGQDFTVADCAAAPALFYANILMPLRVVYLNAAKYLDHLMLRPSIMRVIDEANPYMNLLPRENTSV